MSCPKNKKKLWILKWHGPHDSKDDTVRVFGFSSWSKYEVTKSCPLCGVSLGFILRSEETMQRFGYNVSKLQKLSSSSTDAEDLRQ